jgi:hypothetical protein
MTHWCWQEMEKFLGMTDATPAILQLKEDEKDNNCNFSLKTAEDEPSKEKVTICELLH